MSARMNFKKKRALRPPRLLPGDTIGVVAPAGPFDVDELYRGIDVLESMGFRTSVPDDLLKKDGYLAGPDIHRADLVNRFFADEKIKAIFCARGGFGSMRTLLFLDFELIQKNPKIFVGFSDISAILSVLYSECRLVTFHGPVVTTLGNATQATKTAMFSTLSSDTSLEINVKKGITIKPGLARGPVLGGNLATLCHLVGTPFEPSFEGHILLLEDRGEATYKIDRMLTQMKMAGCFEGLAGVALGSFEACDSMDKIFRIVDQIFSEVTVPILAGFEIGHGRTNIIVPIGLEATLNTDRPSLFFHEPATRGNGDA
ncbi:LD-carboxypeptidase [Desulfobacteraceae bacterium SEEP-SAG9]|nr:LD-carboxypeptidase [Desulfobacteraceae bacterium SEEP-SAG9]